MSHIFSFVETLSPYSIGPSVLSLLLVKTKHLLEAIFYCFQSFCLILFVFAKDSCLSRQSRSLFLDEKVLLKISSVAELDTDIRGAAPSFSSFKTERRRNFFSFFSSEQFSKQSGGETFLARSNPLPTQYAHYSHFEETEKNKGNVVLLTRT